MYRKIFKEIGRVDLEAKSLKGLEPVDESSGEVVIGKLEGNLLRHRVLIEDYLGQLDEIKSKMGEVEECHKVDHGNDDLTQGELKRSCEKHNALIESLEKEGDEIFSKLQILRKTFDAELHEEFPAAKDFNNVVLREGDQIVGLKEADSEGVDLQGIIFAVLRSVLG
jgi:hypothetical protein